MLDVDHLKWSGADEAAAAACLLADVEDTMEDAMAMEDAAMLFDLDDDWLHEHNLDVLFDLFEEELGGSKLDTASSLVEQQQQQLASSPITSCLFGTSGLSLASALDLYELLYLDAASQQQPSTSTPTLQTSSSTTPASSGQPTNTVSSSAKLAAISHPKRHQPPSCGRSSTTTSSSSSTTTSGGRQSSSTRPNSLNVMRIKRRLRKGQSEGVSLLARPSGSVQDNTTTTSRNNNKVNISDKNSSNTASLTNSLPKKLSTTSSTNGIDISNKSQQRNRHLYHYHQHLHYITGCSVIKEHAYAAIRHPTIQIN